MYLCFCLQCFDAVGWAAGRASGLQKLSGGVLVWFSEVRCRLAYSPADATATHCLLLQIGFTFLVLAYLGSPGEHTHFVNFLHLRSMASSLFSLRAWQSSQYNLSRSSLVCLYPQLHTLYISSPNHLLFAAHAHTNAACSTAIPMLCHPVSISTYLGNQDKGQRAVKQLCTTIFTLVLAF